MARLELCLLPPSNKVPLQYSPMSDVEGMMMWGRIYSHDILIQIRQKRKHQRKSKRAVMFIPCCSLNNMIELIKLFNDCNQPLLP